MRTRTAILKEIAEKTEQGNRLIDPNAQWLIIGKVAQRGRKVIRAGYLLDIEKLNAELAAAPEETTEERNARWEANRLEQEKRGAAERAARQTIRAYANFHGYTDVSPNEVVKTISPICVEIRQMRATLSPEWKPDMRVGGFSAHTVNNDSQTYTYQSLPEQMTMRIRWSKAKHNWYDSHGNKYIMADAPRKFYGYNF